MLAAQGRTNDVTNQRRRSVSLAGTAQVFLLDIERITIADTHYSIQNVMVGSGANGIASENDSTPLAGGTEMLPPRDHKLSERTVKKPLKPLSKRKVENYNESLKRRGVVYISRVPPFMKPSKVKQLMEQHGVVTRIYLVEENQANRRARKKAGGNSGKCYTEGWIEFESKKVARAVAESLNNTLIGGRKRNYYHDDMWNLKYLRKFKWDHLTEKVAYERRVRAQRLRLETMQAKRENARYVELVESGRSFAKMEERKRKRASANGEATAGKTEGTASKEKDGLRNGVGVGEAFSTNTSASAVSDAHRRIRRRFKQSKPVADVGAGGRDGGGMDPTVLKSVFGTSKGTGTTGARKREGVRLS